MNPTIRLGQGIDCIPSIHSSSIFAQEVRRQFLSTRYDCVAVELPASLAPAVLEAVVRLPIPSAVVYREEIGEPAYYHIPVEPADSIIEAIRLAVRERIPLACIDHEWSAPSNQMQTMPDEYALKRLGLQAYYEAVCPYLPYPEPDSADDTRERWMAARLLDIDQQGGRTLFVCGLGHLAGIRWHFDLQAKTWDEEPMRRPAYIYDVAPDGYYFLMRDLPYLVSLYERSRSSLDDKEYDRTEGIKELFLDARREFYANGLEPEVDLAPGYMQTMLRYLRNLCLIKNRLTPMLYEMIVSAKGVGGDAFAIELAELAKFYPYLDPTSEYPTLHMGFEESVVPGLGEFPLPSRYPAPPLEWRNIRLERRPRPKKQRSWQRQFNPFGQCSWPAEDERIENFTAHVRKKARGLLGEDQARVEKFSASIKDGLDLRETLRHWHTGDLYVKEVPPVRGDVGAVVFLFDDDYEQYPWRATWQAEHQNESTLVLYATHYLDDVIGPDIGRAKYGGAMFLFPPQPIDDVWEDARFAEAANPAETLVLAGLHYSKERYVAYVARERPSLRLRRIARQLGRHLVFLPLSSFGGRTIRRLRIFHVLGGRQVRSYARDYIR